MANINHSPAAPGPSGHESLTMDILRLAASLEACPVMRVRWFFEGRLACCEGLTSHELVGVGRGSEVMSFLRRALASEQAQWHLPAE